MTTKSLRGQRHLATSPFKPEPEPPIEQFSVDDRVSHDTHGLGRVTRTDASAVTVDFGTHEIRIPSPFEKMERL